MKQIIAIAVLLLFTSNASAALLLQFHNSGQCYDCGPPHGMRFQFEAAIPSQFPLPFPRAEWQMNATPSDVGTTFAMPAGLIPHFNTILTSPENIFGALNCCGGAGGHFFVTPWLSGHTNDIVTIDRFAPNVGPNLNGYYITSITQTVDAFAFEQIDPQTWRANGRHTVSVFGEVVPEPATLVLFAIAFAVIVQGTTR